MTATPVDSALSPTFAEALSKLTGLGLRMAEAITQVTEAEQRTVAVAASWLPAHGAKASSLEEARTIGLDIDTADEALAHAAPRIASLSGAFDRVARVVRRTVALARRIEQGWPLPRGLSDNRRAMLVRQAKRGVGEVIRSRTQGDEDAAERLFDDLDLRLADPDFDDVLMEHPIEEVIRILSRELGLIAEDIATAAPSTGSSSVGAAPPGHARRHDPG